MSFKTQSSLRFQIEEDEITVSPSVTFTAGHGDPSYSDARDPIHIGNYLPGWNNSSGHSKYPSIYTKNINIYFAVSAWAGGTYAGGTYAGYIDYRGFQDMSDIKYKKDIIYLDSSSCLQQALELKPCTYRLKSEPDKPRGIGFIAQDVKEVVPEVVSDDGTGGFGLGYGHLTATLSGAVQELNKIIEEQKQTILSQETRLQNLENIITQLTNSDSFENFKNNLTQYSKNLF
jgi:hypothetical protein